MADHGVGSPLDQSPVGGGEAEGPTEREERGAADPEAHELKYEAGPESPHRVGTARPQQDRGEGPPEGQQPVTRPGRRVPRSSWAQRRASPTGRWVRR